MPLAPRRLQQRLQLRPLNIRQIARIHAPKLTINILAAYSFLGSSRSFWIGSQGYVLRGQGHIHAPFPVL
jgi:nitric oxide reductase large subunit